jgi:hypothetical protein
MATAGAIAQSDTGMTRMGTTNDICAGGEAVRAIFAKGWTGVATKWRTCWTFTYLTLTAASRRGDSAV